MLLSLNVESKPMRANAGVPQLVRYPKADRRPVIETRRQLYIAFLVVLSINVLALSGAAAFLALVHYR